MSGREGEPDVAGTGQEAATQHDFAWMTPVADAANGETEDFGPRPLAPGLEEDARTLSAPHPDAGVPLYTEPQPSGPVARPYVEPVPSGPQELGPYVDSMPSGSLPTQFTEPAGSGPLPYQYPDAAASHPYADAAQPGQHQPYPDQSGPHPQYAEPMPSGPQQHSSSRRSPPPATRRPTRSRRSRSTRGSARTPTSCPRPS